MVTLILSTLLGNLNGSNKIIEAINGFKEQSASESIDIEVNPKTDKFKNELKEIVIPNSFVDIKKEKKYLYELKSNLQQIKEDFNLEGIIGTDKLFDNEVVDRYVASIQGLNTQEATTLLQRQGLSAEQQKQVLVEYERIAANKVLNASLVQESIANSVLNETQKQELLTKLGLINASTGELITTKQVTAAQVLQSLATMGIVGADAAAIMAQLGFAGANTTATATMTAFTASIYANIAAIGAWLVSNPIGWIIMIGTAIATAMIAITQANKKAEEKIENIKKKAEEAKTAIDNLKSSFKETKKTTEDIAEEFAKLSQGVDDLTGKNVSLSTEDYERFLELSNQLADLFPSLSRIYDENGNALVNLSGDVNTITGSLKNLLDVERELANQEIAKKLPEVYEGAKTSVDEYKKAIEENNETLELYKQAQKEQEGLRKAGALKDKNFISGLLNGELTISEDIYGEDVDKVYSQYRSILENSNLFLKNGYDPSNNTYTITVSPSNSGDPLIDIRKDVLLGDFQEDINKIEKDINDLNRKINNEWSSLANNLMSGIQTDGQYKMLNDSAQAYVQNAIGSLDYDALITQFVEDGVTDADKQYEKLEEHIQDNILGLFNNSDVTNLATQLFRLDFSTMNTEEIRSSIMEYINQIIKIAEDLELNREYEGKVVRIMQFGAFVEVAPGKDGMIHISKLAKERVEKVEDVVKIGDIVKVKTINIDEKGRVDFKLIEKLSK